MLEIILKILHILHKVFGKIKKIVLPWVSTNFKLGPDNWLVINEESVIYVFLFLLLKIGTLEFYLNVVITWILFSCFIINVKTIKMCTENLP